jgi:hypothetical protein
MHFRRFSEVFEVVYFITIEIDCLIVFCFVLTTTSEFFDNITLKATLD